MQAPLHPIRDIYCQQTWFGGMPRPYTATTSQRDPDPLRASGPTPQPPPDTGGGAAENRDGLEEGLFAHIWALVAPLVGHTR